MLGLAGLALAPLLCIAESAQPWWHVPHRWQLGGSSASTPSISLVVVWMTAYVLVTIREEQRDPQDSDRAAAPRIPHA